jgi:hypothetical protein
MFIEGLISLQDAVAIGSAPLRAAVTPQEGQWLLCL